MRIAIAKTEHMCYNMGMTNDNVSRETKPYEIILDENGNELRRYPNGIIRNTKGQIIAGQIPQITSENARDFHRMRKEKILNAIEKRVMDITKTNVPAEAIAYIVGKRAEIALKDDSRVGNEAAKIVLQALDAYQTKEEETRTNVLRHEYAMDDETIALLERITSMKRDNRTNVLDYDENSGEK